MEMQRAVGDETVRETTQGDSIDRDGARACPGSRRRLEPRRRVGWLLALAALVCGAVALLVGSATATPERAVNAPWREAGLTERQAAAHALDRLAHGARPGEVDRVVALGLDVWLARQLAAEMQDPQVERMLRGLHSLELSTREIAETYVTPPQVLRRAVAEGIVEQPSPEALERRLESDGARGGPESLFSPAERRRVRAWAEEQGFRPLREALGELMVQKVVRAAFSENQLQEVLVDFWFNHFNVSLTDNLARLYLGPYERDAIRPHVHGDFRTLLEATASHPAMLHYLDNVRSVAGDDATTTMEARVENVSTRRGGLFAEARRAAWRRQMERRQMERRAADDPQRARPRADGLNENYARELLELHTLGVDGGYSQEDVIEVARAFTGWAALPPGALSQDIERRLRRAQRRPEAGFVVDGDFVFRAGVHDAGAKTVLGQSLAAGRGIEDGREVLDLLAAHPSTARHLAHKLAVRFVADEPPATLVDRLAASFKAHGGDLRQVMRALVESPEFWAPEVRRQKIKSPFEVAVSALRATGADFSEPPRQLIEWIERMGQPLYAYQAPTGYPDRADAWVGTGSLLNRMNFGLELAAGGVAGVAIDLEALSEGAEPASAGEALLRLVPRILPERDSSETVDRLLPLVRDPALRTKVSSAAGETAAGAPDEADVELAESALAQVVGVILGSPEFQRR
ncbi:MAG: DUF1800 domain-containing protein [Acidobacteriota bacterium]